MDERKKILLGNKDILSRKIQDFYVNVNLSKDSREIIPYKYDNIFDLTKFYNKERNECRNFIIYGIVDSYACDCNNLTIKIYDKQGSGATLLSTVQSQDVVSTQMPFRNIYGRFRGKYIIDNLPSNYTGYSVCLKLESSDFTIHNQIQDNVFEQQIIFTTLTLSNSGEKVIEKLNYGLNEAVTDCDGNVFEVNNDFDFFYNKHWIKKNLSVSNLNRIWIGNEETKFCETQQNPEFHGRNAYGIFNTGYFAYGETMEVYEINSSSTGNYEPNILISQHYISHTPSNGLCPTAETCSFGFERILLPADGNLQTTNLAEWPADTLVDFYPLNPYTTEPKYETLFLKGEYISGTNITTGTLYQIISPSWNFSYFRLKNQITFIGNSFDFYIQGNSIIQGYYKEVCPWSLNITSTLIRCSNETTIPPANPYTLFPSPQLQVTYSNEQDISINIASGYYIESYVFNSNAISNIAQNDYNLSFNMPSAPSSDPSQNNINLELLYKKYFNLNLIIATDFGYSGNPGKIKTNNGNTYYTGGIISSGYRCGDVVKITTITPPTGTFSTSDGQVPGHRTSKIVTVNGIEIIADAFGDYEFTILKNTTLEVEFVLET